MKYLKNINLSKILFLVLITTIVITELTLSRYESTIAVESLTEIANWNNSLELIDQEPIVLSNGEVNSETIRFNVLSSSEVNSKYSVVFNNIPKDIALILNNASNKVKCFVKDDSIDISFTISGVEKTATFSLDDTNKTFDVTGGKIKVETEELSTRKIISITNTMNSSTIKVEMENDSDTSNIIFENFGQFLIADNIQSIEHQLTLETLTTDLPSMGEIELYVTFEQID